MSIAEILAAFKEKREEAAFLKGLLRYIRID
jgi:hypothetical protein